MDKNTTDFDKLFFTKFKKGRRCLKSDGKKVKREERIFGGHKNGA